MSTTLTNFVSATGNIFGATNTGGNCAINAAEVDVFYDYTINSVGNRITIKVCPTDAARNFRLTVFAACADMTCIHDSTTTLPGSSCTTMGSEVEFISDGFTPSTFIIGIAADLTGGGSTEFDYTVVVEETLPNDSCADAVTLVNNVGLMATNAFSNAPDFFACVYNDQHVRAAYFTYTTAMDNSYILLSTCDSMPAGGTLMVSFYEDIAVNCVGMNCLAPPVVLDVTRGSCPSTTVELETKFQHPMGTKFVFPVSDFADGNVDFSIRILEAPRISNYDCGTATVIAAGGESLSGETNAYSEDYNLCLDTQRSGAWYSYTTQSDFSTIDVSTCTGIGGIPTKITVLTGICGTESCVTNPQLNNGCGGDPLTSFTYRGEFPVGTTLFFVVSSSDPTNDPHGTFDFQLMETPAPPNARCPNAIMLTNMVDEMGTTVDSPTDSPTNFVACEGQTHTSTVFYYYDVQFNLGHIVVSTCPSAGTLLSTILSIYDDGFPVCTLSSCVANPVPTACGNHISYNIDHVYTTGDRITIAVSGVSGTEGTFTIRVEEFAPPPNAFCTTAEPLANGVEVTGTTLYSPTNMPGCGQTHEAAVFYTYTTEAAFGHIEITTCNTAGISQTFVSVFQGDPCTISTADCATVATPQSCGNAYIYYNIDHQYDMNEVLTIVVSGPVNEEGAFSIRVDEFPPPANSYCDTADPLTNGTPVSATTLYSPTNLDTCRGTNLDLSPTVFYSYAVTPSDTTNVEVTTCGSTIDTIVSVFGEGTCIQSQCLAFNDDFCATGLGSRLIVDQSSLGNIIIAVSGYDDSEEGDFTITVNEVPAPVNEFCTSAMVVVEGAPAATGTNLNSAGVFPCNGAPFSYGLWYQYTTVHDFGVLVIDTCGSFALSGIDTEFQLFVGPCNLIGTACGPQFSTNDNELGCSAEDAYARLDGSFAANVQVYFAVYSESASDISDLGDFVVNIDELKPPLNDACVDAQKLNNFGTWTQTTLDSESLSADVPACGTPSPDSPTVYFSYVTEFDLGNLTISTCASSAGEDSWISIFRNDCDSLTCHASNDNFCGTYASITLADNERLPQGTPLIIAVHSTTTDPLSQFTISVEETEIFFPTNDFCSTPTPVNNGVTVFGNTQDSETLRSALPLCPTTPGTPNDSPVVFYSYVTEFQYGDLSVDTCTSDTEFNTFVTIYTEDCATCSAENDDACGFSSLARLAVEQRLPRGTPIIIAVHGSTTTDDGLFSLTVKETGFPEPSNSACTSAQVLENGSPITGTTLGSGFLSGQLPACGAPIPIGSPVVFYTYTTTETDANLSFSTCLAADFDTHLHVYTGDCAALNCISEGTNECGSLSSVELTGYAPGTTFTIAVSGESFSAGHFVLSPNENPTCSDTGPEYECQTSYSLVTDHSCAGVQCVTLNAVPLGNCYDPVVGCGCTTSQTEGPSAGTDLVAAADGSPSYYEIRSIATNAAGITSDECSYRITVVDKCSTTGPKMVCPKEALNLQTRTSCSESDSSLCAVLPDYYPGVCSDKNTCDCTVAQVSGPTPGQTLLIGTYTIVTEATNDFGVVGESCQITVNVTN
eukprot:CAMPEP_0117023290 /NCGR_PEP_ID=MMETSP0472-20121206/17401_1 /TAXON_ID=693140 ORGANISM="Tiarina fusus, Strain LIS" /NCGR_SAMPLE_ID=MMETSP0472 /ASSEMBLY_ACC=CAM_ASM_000603 /LENGTH=1564 /DNA_ID=CAMNT_0004729373 /DNA_START=107 /DNA_END=4801 /DNA_ORIENTATION=-